MKRLPTLLLFAAFLPVLLQAQSVTATIHANNVEAVLHSDGTLFNGGIKGQFIPVQPGLAEISLLRGSGLWITAKDPAGNLKGAVAVNGQTDFKPGFIDEAATMSFDSINKIWRVTCTDIAEHLADFNDNGVINSPNAHVYGYPGRNNNYFEDFNNQNQLPFTPQPMAGFFDRDDDARYSPNTGDYPSAEIRGCALDNYPTEQNWFVFNDLAPHPSGLTSLGMEVQTQVLAYHTVTPSPLNNTLFVRYRLVNRSSVPLDSCYIGLFADFDIGNGLDDFIGTIPSDNILYAYNGDTDDEGNFGSEIPVMAMDMLRGPLNNLGFELPVSHLMAFGNANNLQPQQYHRLLSGRFADGSPAPNGGIMYPDNPNIPGGNSELAAGNTPGLRAGLASYGPFTLLPGADNELIAAYYFVHTPGATPLQNVQQLYAEAHVMQDLFDSCFENMDKNCDGLVPATEYNALESGLTVYPNPAAEAVTIESAYEAFRQMTLTDILGRPIRSIHLDSPVQRYLLPTADLPAGVYVLRVEGAVRTLVIHP